jgi:hypothetical protein
VRMSFLEILSVCSSCIGGQICPQNRRRGGVLWDSMQHAKRDHRGLRLQFRGKLSTERLTLPDSSAMRSILNEKSTSIGTTAIWIERQKATLDFSSRLVAELFFRSIFPKLFMSMNFKLKLNYKKRASLGSHSLTHLVTFGNPNWESSEYLKVGLKIEVPSVCAFLLLVGILTVIVKPLLKFFRNVKSFRVNLCYTKKTCEHIYSTGMPLRVHEVLLAPCSVKRVS